MNLLEQRYRSVLRLLPRWYRAEREEEMVASFLEAAGDVDDGDNPKPRFGEIASVAGLAVRVRLGDVGGWPAPIRWGDAVRLMALLGLLFQAALACLVVAWSIRVYVFGPPAGLGVDVEELIGAPGSVTRAADIAWMLVTAAAIVGYVALVRGHRRTSKIAMVIALISTARAVINALFFGWVVLGASLLYSLPAIVPVVALFAAFHRDAPAVTHQRRWLGALPLLAVVLLVVERVSLSASVGTAAWVTPPGQLCLLLAAAGIGYLCVHTLAPHRRTPAWPLALALLTVPALCARLGIPHPSAFMGGAVPAMIAEGGAAAVIGVVLVALARRASQNRTATVADARSCSPR